MKKVLVNAYAVSPDAGSELGMGWNWCVHMAQYHELFIITEGEFRDQIESAVSSLPQGKNMHFHYLPLSDRIRKMCWNQGDWRFYWHYRRWQKRALELAREIVAAERIDVIHQLNMVGFREPGFLWKIPGIRYVWGPVGGMSQVPLAFFRDVPWKVRCKMLVKNGLNRIQMNASWRVYQAAKRADAVICATEDERRVLSKKVDTALTVIPETGLENEFAPHRKPLMDGKFHLLWTGRFVSRKKLDLALRILAALGNPEIVLDILGEGSREEEAFNRSLADRLGVSDRVIWHGKVPHAQVLEWMCSCDLFLFTSVHEVTSTVIMEAISAGLPIVCFDTCGFGPIVDEQIGRKLPCSNPQQAVRDFSDAIDWLYRHPEARAAMSARAGDRLRSLTWNYKMQKLNLLYGE